MRDELCDKDELDHSTTVLIPISFLLLLETDYVPCTLCYHTCDTQPVPQDTLGVYPCSTEVVQAWGSE
jgi:hypothetical protein